VSDEDVICLDCGCEPCQCELDEYEEERDALALMDCGMMHNGLCTKAGSEECDWECPRGPIRWRR